MRYGVGPYRSWPGAEEAVNLISAWSVLGLFGVPQILLDPRISANSFGVSGRVKAISVSPVPFPSPERRESHKIHARAPTHTRGGGAREAGREGILSTRPLQGAKDRQSAARERPKVAYSRAKPPKRHSRAIQELPRSTLDHLCGDPSRLSIDFVAEMHHHSQKNI